jgi:hypothetical protein
MLSACNEILNVDDDLDPHSENSSEASVKMTEVIPAPVSEQPPKISGSCCVTECTNTASHTLRRKWFTKVKQPIGKRIQIDLDISATATPRGHLLPICETHYETVSHLMVCAMCKRRLPKNHVFYIHQVNMGGVIDGEKLVFLTVDFIFQNRRQSDWKN